MLRNKLMTACSAALLTAALYGCSSSSDDGANMKVQDLEEQIAALSAELGEGEELTPEALAALIQAKADAEAALADAMIAHQAALDQAAMDAETAKQAALDQAAMDAETAKQAALDQAAIDAETAKQAALDQAAIDAEAAKQAALDQAAIDAAEMAATDKQAALDQAAIDAEAAKQAALDQAAIDAEVAKQAALDQAAIDAEAAKQAALDQAAIDAAADLKVVQDELDAANIRIVEIEELAEDALTAKGLADRVAREAMIQAAIATSVSGRVGADANVFPAGVTAVTATRNAAGMVAVEVSDEDYTGGETTAGAGDWNSATLTNGTNTLVVYTDIEAPADKLLTAEYNQDMLDDALDTLRVAKVVSNGFPSSPGTTWDYTGADGARAKTVNGTFDGVPGQFTCTTVGTCMVATNTEGELMPSDDWRFTPMAPLTATVKDPDEAYTYFGAPLKILLFRASSI